MLPKSLLSGKETFNLAPFKYEWAYKMTKHSRQNNWNPEEIMMGLDKLCFEGLPASERHLFRHVFATLTTADLAVQANIAERIYGKIKAAEVRLYLARQIAEEALHSDSYQHVLEVLGVDQEETYSMYQTVPEISQWFEFSTRSLQEDSDLLKMLIFWYAIFEGVFFMTGFAAIYSLQRRNLMTGTGEQLQYIQRDECLSDDTELLTTKGWKLVSEIGYEDSVCQWHPEGTLSFAKPIQLSEHKGERAFAFTTKAGFIDQLVSPAHRMAYYDEHGRLEVTTAEATVPHVGCKFISTGYLRESEGREKHTLTLWEKLQIVVQAAGCVEPSYAGTDTVHVTVAKGKQEAYLRALLQSLEVSFTSASITQTRFVVFQWFVKSGEFKKGFSWVDLTAVTAAWCKEFVSAIASWEEHKSPSNFLVYSTTCRDCIDMAQAVGSLAGYKILLISKEGGEESQHTPNFRLVFNLESAEVLGGVVEKQEVAYARTFYGVQVPSTFLLVRRNGAVSVTGNSMHVAFGIKLIQEIEQETGERHPQAEVHALFKESIERLAVWADYCIPAVLGYSAGLHIEHSKYLADRRLTQLGYAPLFGASNVLPWLDEQSGGMRKEKNFFESRVTEYQTGGVLRFDDADESNLSEVLNWR